MRILVSDPAQLAAGRYRRFVRRAELRGLLADHLYEGQPYLALNAVVLDPSEAALLRSLSELFATAFHKGGQALMRDVPRLVEMGFPWAAAELLAAEAPRMPLAGRFDFIRDEAGAWWLLEFNADTPSGTREAIVADELVYELLPQARNLARPNLHLADALRAAFCAAVADMPPGLALGIITDAGELEDLAQMAFTAELLAAPLAARGTEVVLGDIRNLGAARGGLTLCGKRIGALYRYLPFESLFGTAGFAAIYEAAIAGKIRLLNGLYGLLLQHKGLMAWLWAHREEARFTAAERAAIDAHLAPAWTVSCLPPAARPSELVFKQVFGREGEEVFFGADLTADDLARIERRRTYIAQRRIQAPPLEAAVPTPAGFERRQLYATAGSYVVDGQWAGFYTRLGDRIVTARAKWLATFVKRKGLSDGREREASG